MAHSLSLCNRGPWFRRCKGPAVGICQYCAKPFCAEHGVFLDEGQEICTDRLCQTKYHDVGLFRAYRKTVLARNEQGQCGSEGCEEGLWGQCSKCEGVFCQRHISQKVERLRVGRAIRRRPVAVCDYCAARLELWGP